MVMNARVELLSDEECHRLLELETIGRVGLSLGALPAIFPVNYWIVDGAIVFRTGEGLKLRAALHRTVIAFEVDHTDPQSREGWSVLAVGLAVVLPDEGHLSLPPSWAGDGLSHVVQIQPEFVSGRRIFHT